MKETNLIIENLKAILEECTASEDAVSYVNSEDAGTLKAAIEALEKQEQDRWRPVFDGDGEMPEVNEDGYSDYILVNFSNVPETFDIAQYRVNESGEGAFYSGDDEDPYTKIGIFVSAWRPLPEPYKAEENHEHTQI